MTNGDIVKIKVNQDVKLVGTLNNNVKLNMKKDVEVLQEVLKHLRIMRDTWEEVMKLAKR